jgi:hypothetical protein
MQPETTRRQEGKEQQQKAIAEPQERVSSLKHGLWALANLRGPRRRGSAHDKNEEEKRHANAQVKPKSLLLTIRRASMPVSRL